MHTGMFDTSIGKARKSGFLDVAMSNIVIWIRGIFFFGLK